MPLFQKIIENQEGADKVLFVLFRWLCFSFFCCMDGSLRLHFFLSVLAILFLCRQILRRNVVIT